MSFDDAALAGRMTMAECRFGDGPAIVRVAMDRGCVCYPDDREQLLCAHHWYKSEPLGSFEVIEELQP